jgi:hypothetical protein
VSLGLRGVKNRTAIIVAAALGMAIAHADELPARHTPNVVIAAIAECLVAGNEMAMTVQAAKCVGRGQGGKIAEDARMPFSVDDPGNVCANEQDHRVLWGDAIKRLVTEYYDVSRHETSRLPG